MDYLRLDITHAIDTIALFNRSDLSFCLVVDAKTGEIEPFYKDTYQRIKPTQFTVYEKGRIEVYEDKDGRVNIHLCLSVAELWKGSDNAIDIHIDDYRFIIEYLTHDLGLNPHKAFIRKLEFCALLTDLSYPSDHIILHTLAHTTKGAPLESFNYQKFRKHAHYKIMDRNKMKIKIYDKQLDCELPYPMFKIEIKADGRWWRERGVNTLADTLCADNWKVMSMELQKAWDNSIVFDPRLRNQDLSNKEKLKIKDLANPNYWRECRQVKNKVSREKNRLKKLHAKYNCTLHLDIAIAIKNKCTMLTAQNEKCGNLRKVVPKVSSF